MMRVNDKVHKISRLKLSYLTHDQSTKSWITKDSADFFLVIFCIFYKLMEERRGLTLSAPYSLILLRFT